MKRWIALIAALAFPAAAVDAHHSIAGAYDSAQQVTIEAVVTNFQFVNPHPYLLVDGKRSGGTVQQWKLEMDNRRELTDVGMKSDTFRPGDRIVVNGWPGREQPQNLYIVRLDRASDGFRYEQIGNSPRIQSDSRRSKNAR